MQNMQRVMKMLKYLEKLCSYRAPSGGETCVSEYIKSVIAPKCESVETDNLGNLIAFKKGANRPKKTVQLDAHTDEVGVIITAINPDGTLNFATVGGINCESLVSKRFRFGDTVGVVATKPIHLLSGDEKGKLPDKSSLQIDIGAADKAEAEQYVRVGDLGTFDTDYSAFGDGRILSRALDDRLGCAVLMELIDEDLPYDAYFTFSVQEEVGCRGAKADTFAVNPDFAIVLEATTAADIVGMPETKQVCKLGEGAAVSFMDSGTLYEKALYDEAFKAGNELGIKVQPKAAPTGGNDAGAIHLTRDGVRTLAISVPCRYLHSAAGVIDEGDAECVLSLAREMYIRMASGEL